MSIPQHMSISQHLQQALSQRLLRPLDLQFARMLADDSQPALMLAAALTSRHTGAGHVCLALDSLNAENCFIGQHQPPAQALAQQLFALAGAPAHWRERLLASAAVSEGQCATPLKLAQQRLYLHRLWHNEQCVIRFFRQQNHAIEVNEEQVSCLLNQLFSQQPQTDWQKIAVAVALTRRIAIISGGPGTGKTTTVARLLQALVRLNPHQTNAARLRIRLAAPTGKAAARLNESLNLALQRLPADHRQLILPGEASTLHRLLGVRQGSQHPRYHADNPLHLDLLVVDEASMIDLPMMARLIAALPGHARLILLGDHDQLASVEAGAVLGDLCHYAHDGYSRQRAGALSRLTGYHIAGNDSPPLSELRDSLCLLRKSYRFQADSGIGQLALAVNQGDAAAMRQLLARGCRDVQQKNLASQQDYQNMIADALQGYQHYLHALSQPERPAQILQAFSEYQLLCALREGAYGVRGLNQQLEAAMLARQLIRRARNQRWYHGRPIMISRNDSSLGLFNGDTGITLQQHGDTRVWFTMPDGELKPFAPSRLPAHETAWALTVHKSQGSEFDHAALVLPPQHNPLISREMVYTAITRARQQLSLYADLTSLQHAIATRRERHSGLLQGFIQPDAGN